MSHKKKSGQLDFDKLTEEDVKYHYITPAIENAGWGQHDDNATTWVDLIGDYDLALHNTDVLENRVHFANNAYATCDTEITTESTVEVVMSNEQSRTELCFLSLSKNNNSAAHFMYWYVSKLSYQIPANSTTNCAAMQTDSIFPRKTISFVIPDTVFFNGEVQNATTNRDFFNKYRGVDVVINPSSSWSFSGDIYSLRLYSRALTADEIAHNYEIDKIRFNLP